MNTIKKLSFNTNINANSNKPFTSRTITKSHRKSRPISTNSSPGRIYSNVNDSKMISKLKSEISIMNNMLMNENKNNELKSEAQLNELRNQIATLERELGLKSNDFKNSTYNKSRSYIYDSSL